MVSSSSFPLAVSVVCTILASTANIMVSAGSQRCKTLHHPTYSEVNCSGSDLDHIPWDLHSNIRVLDLSNNIITQLQSDEFGKYSSLQTLILKNNSIVTIHKGAFNGLKILKDLDLSSNKLSLVPTEALQIEQLARLSLKGNRLSVIEDNSFVGLPSLKILDLDGNHIRTIHKNALIGLRYLQTLELQNNALQWLDNGVLRAFAYNLLTLRLYNNPWFCDCRLHWLKSWLDNDTHSIRWEFPNHRPSCDGPSFMRKKHFSSVPLENFACPPEMYTNDNQRELTPGSKTKLLCKYFSMPDIAPIWYKNGEPMVIPKKSNKYNLREDGIFEKSSTLVIKNFQHEDIAEYKCVVANIRGSDSITFTVTLEGVPIESLTTAPVPEPLGAGVDMKSVVISVAVICGLVLLIITIILIVCVNGRYQRAKAMKKQEIANQVKEHFITNGDLSMKSLDHLDDNDSLTNSNIDSNNTKDKLSDQEDTGLLRNSLSNICRPSSPNGHTYMSFDSELTDNDELNQIYSAIRSPPRAGSHTESTTPLLDYYAPSSSLFDSRDPLDNSSRLQSFSSVPRQEPNYYWSNNHLPRTPGSTRSTQIYNEPHYGYRTTPDYRDYRDYRDPREYREPREYQDYRSYRYPSTTPPSVRMQPTKKSASVGNLGLQQRTPAPRKPPRTYKSGERIMSDSVDDTHSEIGRVLNDSSIPGLPPGTPV